MIEFIGFANKGLLFIKSSPFYLNFNFIRNTLKNKKCYFLLKTLNISRYYLEDI